MTPDAPSNTDQIDYWNTKAGPIWAELQEQLDRQIAPLGLEAIRALAPAAGERILDVGCGCGQTTADLAARVGRDGAVVGVDISRPMLGVARGRAIPPGAARPQFREVDAQSGELGEGAFDAAFSRLGVMFFSDPSAAFANIRKALKPGGRLTFVCFRSPGENPMLSAPAVAAAPFLPPAPPADPAAPGPFALADPVRTRQILTQAGFADISIEPFDTKAGGASLDDTLALNLRIGPLGAALRKAPDIRGKAAQAVRAALEVYLTEDGVRLPAAVWIVSARTWKR